MTISIGRNYETHTELMARYYISGEECDCRDWHGCIMQQSIVGMENIQPYKFSDCSLNDYIDEFRETRNMCLLNKPNEVNFQYYIRQHYVLDEQLDKQPD